MATSIPPDVASTTIRSLSTPHTLQQQRSTLGDAIQRTTTRPKCLQLRLSYGHKGGACSISAGWVQHQDGPRNQEFCRLRLGFNGRRHCTGSSAGKIQCYDGRCKGRANWKRQKYYIFFAEADREKEFPGNSSKQNEFTDSIMARIKTSTNATEPAKSADIVIEAIVENLNAKQALFKSIDSVAPKHTIFASNTSSLPISQISSVTSRQDRFAGLHFFNPVSQMKLVEIICTEKTSSDVHDQLFMLCKALGKVPVFCKDTPG